MSFIQLRPYIKSGETLKVDRQYISHWMGAGVTVDSWDVTQINQQEPIKLKITDSVKVTRDLKKNKNKTYNTGNKKSSYVYFPDGDAGFTFTIKCITNKYDTLPDGKTVYWYLNHFYTNDWNVNMVIDNEIVPNGVYTISEFKSIDLIRKNYYELEIEFTKHTSTNKKITNKVTVLQARLNGCSYPSKKITNKAYTTKQIDKAIKKKKNKDMLVGKCLQYVNEILYKKGFYGAGVKKTKAKTLYKKYHEYWSSISKRALIRFQKKWNKQKLQPKVNEKGTFSKNTWKALKKYPELK